MELDGPHMSERFLERNSYRCTHLQPMAFPVLNLQEYLVCGTQTQAAKADLRAPIPNT